MQELPVNQALLVSLEYKVRRAAQVHVVGRVPLGREVSQVRLVTVVLSELLEILDDPDRKDQLEALEISDLLAALVSQDRSDLLVS